MIDQGVDWKHCDFGGNTGHGEKVSSGWNWVDNNSNYDIPGHGTHVASIIGGYTNRNCVDTPHGITGIAGGWGPSGGNPDEGKGCQIVAHAILSDDEEVTLANVVASTLASVRSTGYGVHIVNMSLGFEEYSGALNDVIVDAHANEVVVTASSGNRNLANLEYPAGLSDDYVIAVGGVNVQGTRFNDGPAGGSNYGHSLDLVAPQGTLNPPNRLNYTAYGKVGADDGWSGFNGTSAAAPYAAGIAALLHAESFERNYGWTEPEDYQGIIKASCYDIPSDELSPDYNIQVGWGHVNAERIFEMIADGYDVHHYSTSTSDLTYGDWGSEVKMVFARGKTYDVPLDTRTVYLVSKRKVTATIDIPITSFTISNDYPAYVWGRSGPGSDGGWSAANPNYQTAHTKIISGIAGSNQPETPGIRFDHLNSNDKITVENWQYRVRSLDGVALGDFPANNKLGHKVTLFARSVTTDVPYNVIRINAITFPNPTSDKLTLRSDEFTDGQNITLRIINSVGSVVATVTRTYKTGGISIALPKSEVPPGAYILCADAGGDTVTRMFIVQ